uniref:UDP-2,3-diacylglucosamine diphosphatase n=1 Tax=Rhodoferax sp. TaxID=50421 RepID=UPI00374CBD8A
AHWRRLDFISDLHLQAGDPATFKVWQHFMQTTRADAVFILGDLFDVWVGDDALATPGFETRCAQVLQTASQRLAIFLMHGNRDFLLGATFAQAGGLTLLDDPCVLIFAGQRWLLSHGDALCLGDTDYLQFRAQVRSAAWQQDFLSLPLAQRQHMAQGMRMQSETHKRSGAPYVDLDEPMTCHWLEMAQASTLIHGHTHQPADHPLADGLHRIVLSDWDACATPPRAEVLRLSVAAAGQAKGSTVQRLEATLQLD